MRLVRGKTRLDTMILGNPFLVFKYSHGPSTSSGNMGIFEDCATGL
jgi:hypothetical protein